MYYPEELASLVLAVALALFFLLRPAVAYEYLIYLYRGADTGSGGSWGSDPAASDRATLAIRAIGLILVLVAIVLLLSPWYRDAVF